LGDRLLRQCNPGATGFVTFLGLQQMVFSGGLQKCGDRRTWDCTVNILAYKHLQTLLLGGSQTGGTMINVQSCCWTKRLADRDRIKIVLMSSQPRFELRRHGAEQNGDCGMWTASMQTYWFFNFEVWTCISTLADSKLHS
jgi:hypothetical protein